MCLFQTEAELRGCIKGQYNINKEFLTVNHAKSTVKLQDINIHLEMCICPL